ncbi:MAG TPA: AI-2E family transporter [Chitinophagaceae bacterium]|nr:AI-2E family transporter [Chitinophagaceae bacterium]
MLQTSSLQRTLYFLLLAFLIVAALYYAKPFLVPVCFGGLLAMLFLPLSLWFESKKIPTGLSILFCIIIFLGILTGIIWIISWQITDLASEASDIENKMRKMITQVEEYIRTHFGISPRQQEKLITEQTPANAAMFSNIGSFLTSFIIDFILVLVYIFLFMFYRKRIKTFILHLVSPEQKKNAETIIYDIEKVSKQYITGLGLMIVCLWIMYSIGFSVVGVKYAVLFAIICGLLEIVPFVGNLTGNLLAVSMVVIQGGGIGMVLGVVITYLVVQFLQTYLLEPLVVGAEVNINPLFTIIILVLGELVWGIPGMVLAIPLLGIFKIICDHVQSLKPYGYLIGGDRKKRPALLRRKK